MSIELSTDLRQAVDLEGTPLKLIDPRTGSVYLLVPEDRFHSDLRPTNREPVRNTSASNWTNEKNHRRCELIDREIAGTISTPEAAELDDLQAQMLTYRQEIAPLPLDDLRRLHHDLLSRADNRLRTTP
jgi:hypothetical protein